jgi:hypothetical protein
MFCCLVYYFLFWYVVPRKIWQPCPKAGVVHVTEGTFKAGKLFCRRDQVESPESSDKHNAIQGCQMVCFQTKNTNLGKFGWVLLWKIVVYFMTIWSILRPLEIFYGHLVYFTAIGNILWPFGIFCGNLVYFFPVLVFWTKKNLATLMRSLVASQNSLSNGHGFQQCSKTG